MNDDLPESLHCDPSRWIELRDSLQAALDQLPDNSWKPVIDQPTKKSPSEEEKTFLRQQLIAAYRPHTNATIRAISHMLNQGRWPDLKPPEVYYLRQMLARTLMFLQSILLEPRGRPTTILPFPQHETAQVALWFLTEWWIEHGLLEIIHEATTDQALFHRYFG